MVSVYYVISHLLAAYVSRVVARSPDGELITDQLLPTPPYVAQANWRPTEDVGNHDQGRSGAPLRNASLRLSTMEKGLGESL